MIAMKTLPQHLVAEYGGQNLFDFQFNYAMLADPAFRSWLGTNGVEPMAGSSSDFQRFLVSETERWGRIVRSSGARVE